MYNGRVHGEEESAILLLRLDEELEIRFEKWHGRRLFSEWL